MLFLPKRFIPGFSLAEVLIAIVIIAILTVGAIAAYSSYLGRARDTERQNDLARIKMNLDTIVAQYGAPPGSKVTSRSLKKVANCSSNDKALFKCFQDLKLSDNDDLTAMFTDPSAGVKIPKTQSEYKYKYGSNENSYAICATFEDQASIYINADVNGGMTPGANVTTNMYCLRYTPPGANPVVSDVSEIDATGQ